MSYAEQIAVLMIIMFSALAVPVALAASLYRWYKVRQQNKTFSLDLLKVSTLNNYSYKQSDPNAHMIFSSYRASKLTDVLSGKLPHSGNKFFIARQEEIRGSLNSIDVSLRRTVTNSNTKMRTLHRNVKMNILVVLILVLLVSYGPPPLLIIALLVFLICIEEQ